MVNKKEYLKNLLIVKRNLQKFLTFVNDNNFHYDLITFLASINREINKIKNQIEKEDNTYFSSLYTIYDFGVGV